MPTSVIITLIICITLIILVLITGNREKASVEETVNDFTESVLELTEGVVEPMAKSVDELELNDKITKEVIAKIVIALSKAGIMIDGIKVEKICVDFDDEEECGEPDKCCDEPSDAKPVKKTKKTAKTDKCETESMDCPSK